MFFRVLTFLNFFARRLAPRELAFSPGRPFPLEVGDKEFVSKIAMSWSVWPEAKKLRILIKKHVGVKEYVTFRLLLAGFA